MTRDVTTAEKAPQTTGRQGFVHLYCGDGKGKTTAAMGLAARALGRGQTVVILQFCKDGSSGEVASLRRLGATILAGNPDGRFARLLNADERAALRDRQNALLEQAHDLEADLLVLDEACFAARQDLVDSALLKAAVLQKPRSREVVLTGRDPLPWMEDAADYITEMRCVRHPYERGVTAREGVEL